MPATNQTLLRATRGLLWLMLALVVAAALALVGVAIAVVVVWPDVVAEIQNMPELVDASTMRLPLGILLLLLIAVLGVAAYILRQLQAMVASASRDPFIIDNAWRLRRIGWSLVTIQLLALPVHWMAANIAKPGSDFSQMGGLSVGSLLAILLAFVLAAVFEQGAAMRDELEGTV